MGRASGAPLWLSSRLFGPPLRISLGWRFCLKNSCLQKTWPFPFCSQIWQAALNTLNPNPTDSCPLYLNHATVAALPSRVSRHNSPSAAQFLTRVIRTCLPGGTKRCILVSEDGRESTQSGKGVVFLKCQPAIWGRPRFVIILSYDGNNNKKITLWPVIASIIFADL